MDPNQAYKDFCRALLEENASQARESYNAIRVWLDRGGFEPSWTPAQRRQFFTFDPRTGAALVIRLNAGRPRRAQNTVCLYMLRQEIFRLLRSLRASGGPRLRPWVA